MFLKKYIALNKVMHSLHLSDITIDKTLKNYKYFNESLSESLISNQKTQAALVNIIESEELRDLEPSILCG